MRVFPQAIDGTRTMMDKVTPKPGGKGRGGFSYDEAETKIIIQEMLDASSGADKDRIAKHYNTSEPPQLQRTVS